MSNYRRATTKGGTYFFTVVSYRRRPILCEEHVRASLRDAIGEVRGICPFAIDGWVLLPDHLRCIWTLPEGDADFAKRWGMIKRFVSKPCGPQLHCEEWMSDSKRRRHDNLQSFP